MTQRKKICFVAARPGSIRAFLSNHIAALSKDYDIYMVANFDDPDFPSIPGVTATHHIAINRAISVGSDLKAVRKLARYFRQMRFDAVHSLTPKAGLLTALAAKSARIKERIHIFTGQVWATRTGAMRTLLKAMDRLIVRLDNHILVDGESQRQYLIQHRIVKDTNSRVLGAGSICGVDNDRFTPDAATRTRERAELGIADNKTVYTFMGRLNKDKGVFELLDAFNRLVAERPDAYLLLFGRDEENCMARLNEYPNIRPGENFHYYGNTSRPHQSLQAGDIFVLPSYREGFGMSVIEASCLGLPVICSDAYGMSDTMVEGQTGLRCKIGDSETLYQAMKTLHDNPEMRNQMGQQGRRRTLDLFAADKIVSAWTDFYHSVLAPSNQTNHK